MLKDFTKGFITMPKIKDHRNLFTCTFGYFMHIHEFESSLNEFL